MQTKLNVWIATLTVGLLWANQAFAGCILGIICIGGGKTGGGPSPAPEIDGAAGLSAMALLACIAAIAYRKIKR